MRILPLLPVFALAACAAPADDVSQRLAARDEAMAKLMDQNAELEKRVGALEARLKLVAAGSRSLPVATSAAPLDVERDRLDRRVTELERDAGKMPPP